MLKLLLFLLYTANAEYIIIRENNIHTNGSKYRNLFNKNTKSYNHFYAKSHEFSKIILPNMSLDQKSLISIYHFNNLT